MADLSAEFFERLTDPRAIPILARHAIPVIGVFVLGWSVLETLAALVLDALSTLWMLSATAAYFGAKTFDYGETGVLHAFNFWAGVLCLFLVAAALLTFALAVPTFMLMPLLMGADVDPQSLVTSGWLPRAFALMVVCQLPGVARRIRTLAASGMAPEKMGLDGEIGFVLHRSIVLTATGWMLGIFGSYALHLLVILGQVIGAGSELMRDHYLGYLMKADRRPPAATTPSRRRRRRKR